ncbi:MAG: alginate lyase family protein, partial [Armatimonadota bacterium]
MTDAWRRSGGLLMMMVLCGAGSAFGQGERVPLPETLPDHPRLLLSAEEIAHLKALRAEDPWVDGIIGNLVASAEGSLGREIEVTPGERHRAYAGPARDLGLACQFTGDVRFARKAAAMLLAYADLAPTLQRSGSSGLLTDSTLGEGNPATDLAWAYDLIYNAGVLSDAQKRHIEDDLLRRIALVAGHGCHHRNSSNWRSWGLVCLAAGGFATGHRDLIDEAINGVYDEARKSYLYGFSQQIAHSFFADGTFWERSIGYTYYTLRPLSIVAEMARHSGIDLWTREWPGLRERPPGGAHDDFGPPGPRSIRYGLDALLYRAFPDMSCARVADSGTRRITSDVRIHDAIYPHVRDPKYAWLIWRSRQRNARPVAGWRVWQPEGRMAGEVDEAVTHRGRSSFRLRSESTANRAALYQSVPVEPGRTYRFSIWVRTKRVAGG